MSKPTGISFRGKVFPTLISASLELTIVSPIFDFRGVKGKHHLFGLRLPAYGISATLHVPLNRVFYQAGIQHAGGTLILRIRTALQQ